MKKLRIFCIVLAVVMTTVCAPWASAEEIDMPAKAAVMIEQESGRVLYAKNENQRLPMASTTKIMTALIILEECDLSAIVDIDSRMSGIEGSSMYLEVGEKLTVEELLYGLMIRSGNDAATALAIHAYGSVEAFAARMNERAKELGLVDTKFKDPHGLASEGHFTTAYELAMIAREAMKSEIFREIITTERKVVAWDGHEWDRVLTNKNKILDLIDGGNGIKTGYTKAAGRCLVSGAYQENMQLIAVTLNCGDDFNMSAKLLQSGFDDYDMLTLAPEGAVIGQVKTDLGYRDVIAGGEMRLPMKENEQLTYAIEIPQSIHGSYDEGAVVGWVDIKSGEEKIATFELCLKSGVDSESFWGKIRIVVNNW